MNLTTAEIQTLSSRPTGAVLINAGTAIRSLDARTIERALKIFTDMFGRVHNDRRPDLLIAPPADRDAMACIPSPAEPELGSVLSAAIDRYPWMRDAVWSNDGAPGHRGATRWVFTRRLEIDQGLPARLLYADFCELGEGSQSGGSAACALAYIESTRYVLSHSHPTQPGWSDVDIIGYATELGWRG
ncbi:MAG TPA: hypothetical protein VMX11_00170 [Actinomycetes bacterium]|nr:hypothetical protein [Actinomycetes bacterium]